MNYTEKLKLRKPEGGEYYNVEDFNGNADLIDAAITGKINKPAEYVAGNFAAVSASGNIEDSGKKPSDFATSAHNHNTVYGPISHVSDKAVHISTDQRAAIATVVNKADKNYVDAALVNMASAVPLSSVTGGTLSLLSILLEKISIQPFYGHFSAYEIPDLPHKSDQHYGVKYEHLSGDDYKITATGIWVNDVHTRVLNAYRKSWNNNWRELATV